MYMIDLAYLNYDILLKQIKQKGCISYAFFMNNQMKYIAKMINMEHFQ